MNAFDRITSGRSRNRRRRRLSRQVAAEATVMGDIAYLPSGVGTVKAAVKSLAKLKKKWGLEIIGDSRGRKVMFEDQLSIYVPHECWADFSSMFDSALDKGTVDLSKYLTEALGEELDELKEEIRPALTTLFEEEEFIVADKVTEYWIARFGVRSYQRANCLVRVESKRKGIQRLVSDIQRIYGRDPGHLELLLEALANREPLNAFEGFKKQDFLYGTRIVSEHETCQLVFEATIDMAYLLTMSITIDDEDVAEELEYMSDVKVVRNVVYPIQQYFTSQFFSRLDDVLEDAIDSDKDRELR